MTVEAAHMYHDMPPLNYTSADAGSKTHTKHLLDLSDALPLDVLKNLGSVPRRKRTELIHTVLVCRRLRPFAFEALLSYPVVHIYSMQSLVRTYLQHFELTARVRSLELYFRGRRDFDLEGIVRASALAIYASG
jgi:hypothetical protein